jgi:hypothetical protein
LFDNVTDAYRYSGAPRRHHGSGGKRPAFPHGV